MNGPIILVNKARCRVCGQIVEAQQDDQYLTYCRCGRLAVSGGRTRLVREGDYDELSIMEGGVGVQG